MISITVSYIHNQLYSTKQFILQKKTFLVVHGVNFTKILRAVFLYESFARIFLYLHFRFIFLWRNNIGAKAAHKKLVKLTQGCKCKEPPLVFDLLIECQFTQIPR